MSGAQPPEFPRPVDIRQADGRHLRLEADERERAALAVRFGLVRIDWLQAELDLSRKDRVVEARGTIRADFIQSCAVSAEDLTMSVQEPLYFRFVPARTDHAPDEETEIGELECDEIDYTGTIIDVGEAVAQSLALAIDPFATGPDADEARARLGSGENSPFAALKSFKPGE